jgi:diguanylate cyclase (GGDEF)-like protein
VVGGDGPELATVSGYSGIGKTALVRELMQNRLAQRTLFLSGKYDQYKRDIPFATVAQAFGGLVRQILREGDAGIEAWRAALVAALAGNGQVVVDVVPELEWLIGAQPPVLPLGPTEAHHRFQAVFRRFVGACATASHPLVLFLDDLQWIDPASLALIEVLLTQPPTPHLLLIGAYRDNEVAPAHPLALALERIAGAHVATTTLVLQPLAATDIGRLTADAIRSDEATAQPLAEQVFARTGGNPYFAIQFLHNLVDEALLCIDRPARRWRWQAEGIDRLGYADNVVDLMVAKLQRLPAPTQQALKLLACLGTASDASLLALAEVANEARVAAGLEDAVRAGLVIATADGFRFAHDRVQEAAYSLVAPAARQAMHRDIGRWLLASLPAAAIDERVFELVDHFNRSGPIEVRDERLRIAHLNAQAGARAKGAAAYAAARHYYEQASVQLPAPVDTDAAAFRLGVLMELAECEFLCGRFERAETVFDEALAQAGDDFDRARVLGLRMRSWRSVGRVSDALALGLQALRLLGQSFPEDDDQARQDFAAEQREFRTALGTRAIADLHDLPVTNDPVVQAGMALLADAAVCAYNVRPLLTPLLYARALNLALRHGNSPVSCMTYISYGSLLVALGDMEGSLAFADLALRLNETFADLRLRGTLLYVRGVHVDPWQRPLAQSVPVLEQGFLACQEVGNLMFAAYNAASLVSIVIETGEALPEARRIARRYSAFAREHRVEMMFHWLRVSEQFVANLRGETPAADRLDADDFSEDASLAAFRQGQFQTGIGHLHLNRASALLFHGLFAQAVAASQACEGVARAIRSGPLEASHVFVHCLGMAAIHDDVPAAEQAALVAAIDERVPRLRFWAVHAPQNYANRLALVEAELARIRQRPLDAIRGYDLAIRDAREHGFVQNEGLASERAAAFYRALGADRIADGHLRDARRCYAQWGATALVARIDREHPGLAQDRRAASTRRSPANLEHLDLLSVLKASQAVSNDIVLDSLVDTLLRIAIEHAGADRGLLILAGDGEWRVVARADATGGAVHVVVGPVAVADAELPAAVLGYVLRSREQVLLDLDRASNPFAADAYFREHAPKSLLCLPLVKQGSLVGVLYLENRLTPGAFSERTQVLELLASQAAISLENATLYANLQREQAAIRELNADLERRVAERTQALAEKSAQFERLAREDALTGLNNRRHFEACARAALAECQARGEPVAAALIDLDHFKRINDGHSHAAGDAVLRTAGELIRRHLREPAISGRYGGEEFAVLFPGLDMDAAAAACEALRVALQSHDFAAVAVDLRVTLSGGVALAGPGENLERLLGEADARLYRAKSSGRNRVWRE